MVAIIAAMRKLLHICFGVVKNQKLFKAIPQLQGHSFAEEDGIYPSVSSAREFTRALVRRQSPVQVRTYHPARR